jgi:hypothetical protein
MPKQERPQKTKLGHEIPISSRGEFIRDLAKVARPPSDRKRRPKKNLGK